MFQNLIEYIPNTSIRVVCATCLWVQKYFICLKLHNTKNYWTFHNLLVFFQCCLIFLLQSLNMLIYFSINIASSTWLNSLLVLRPSMRLFYSVSFTWFFSKKRREEQASGVLTRSMSREGTDVAIKHCVQLRVCLWLQISSFRRIWLFSLKIFLSFCFILVTLCGNKISLIVCSLGLNSLIFSPEIVKAFVISPSNLIMLIQ